MDDTKVFESSDHHTQFIKGKRSKRQRPSLSPHASTDHSTTAMTTSFSSSSTCDDQEGQNGYFSSSTTSIEMLCSTTSTEEEQEEEEEEMANCLILLAQGGSKQGANTNPSTSTSLYVYECKTCNRTFPSFQALGGHRASHKKHPKARPTILVEEKRIPKIPFLEDELEQVVLFKKNSHNPSHELSFQEGSNKKLKVHECSICGCEFTSGQALGGHMRRHRVSSNVIVDINKSSNISLHNKYNNVMERQRNMLQLDLNLPAPEDDHREESQFQFVATHQVFSAPALVDCHY